MAKTFCLFASISEDIAEKVFRFLPVKDLPNVRLVNKHWCQFTSRYFTTLRPTSLEALKECTHYPSASHIDLSLVDIEDDAHFDSVATALTKLPSLERLTLRCGSRVTNQGFDNLAVRNPQLQQLNLQPIRNGCVLPERPAFDVSIIKFEQFQCLTSLDLSWNRVTQEALESISSLSKLQSLNIKNCIGVDDTAIEALIPMPSLRVLNLSAANVTDDGLMMMNDLELSVLNLSKCEGITDDGLFWLQHIRTLQKLDISACPQITSAGVEQLVNLPSLTHLYLQDVKSIGTSFFDQMQQLQVLSLRDNFWVTNETLKDLTRCPYLHSVNLRNCHGITDHGLEFLLQMPSLRSVNLRGCSKITDKGMDILSAMSAMEDIDLSFLSQVTDSGLKSMAKITNLRRLILNWCNMVTAVGLHAIRGACTGLEELSIKGCHNMESTDLAEIASTPSVQKLDYEHSMCSTHPSGAKKNQKKLPLMRHIDSVGCFAEIC